MPSALFLFFAQLSVATAVRSIMELAQNSPSESLISSKRKKMMKLEMIEKL
jgi:hypothetical protein